jgi:aminoglycoside phosphotransferase (APT) family kinase protein
LPVLHSNLSIRIPHLLHHDLTKHVLIQSDLGNIPELYKFLTSPDTTPALASSAGAALGRFLKDLHGAFYHASETTKEELRHRFANDEGEAVLCKVIASVLGYMKDAGVEDYVLLEKRAQDNWTGRERTVFGQGDIWFGTVLVGVEDGTVEVGICDWEFAGFNHPAGDIAQLG